jgi:two-component system chemotaxis response regulator CheY
MRKVVERELRLAGMDLTEVLFAREGREALEILRARHPSQPLDLILTDINMPVMNGLDFLERRLAEGLAVGVPVAMITTEESEPLILRAIAVGAQAYICKPFDTAQIRQRLLPLLARRHAGVA